MRVALAWLAAAFAFTACGSEPNRPAVTGPNILLITVSAMSADALAETAFSTWSLPNTVIFTVPKILSLSPNQRFRSGASSFASRFTRNISIEPKPPASTEPLIDEVNGNGTSTPGSLRPSGRV